MLRRSRRARSRAAAAETANPVTRRSLRRASRRRPRLGVLIEPASRCFDLLYMRKRPKAERFDRLAERVAEAGQFVIDARRTRREDRSGHETVAFEPAQNQSEHPLRD